MFLIPYLYILLVVVLQNLALFTPIFSDVFRGPGFSAAIFTVSLFTSHWAIFWPRLKPWHALAVIPLLALTEFITLSTAMTIVGDAALQPHHPLGFLPESGYNGMLTSMLIQSPLSVMVSIGLWMGGKYGKFIIRRAGLDQEEQWNLFTFRMNRLGDDENTFFKYRNLLNRGISVVGSRKRKIHGVLSSLRMNDTLYLYDLFIDPETDRKDLDRDLIERLVNRGEIMTTSMDRAVLTVPDSEQWLAERAPGFGFTEITDPNRKETMYRELDSILSERYSNYHPFERLKYYFEYIFIDDRTQISHEAETENT